MNARLALLTFRRALGGGLIWFLLPVLWLASRAQWAPTPGVLADLLAVGDACCVAGGLTLRGVWSLLLLALAPWSVFRAAAVIPRWRRGELDWLASAAASAGTLARSAAIGLALAATALVLVAQLAAGWNASAAARAAGGAPASETRLRVGRPLELPAAVLDQHLEPLTFPINPGADAAFVRLQLFPIGGGRSVRVRATVSSLFGTTRESAEVLVAGRTELRIPVPQLNYPDSVPRRLELQRVGPGPIVMVAEGSAQTLVPAPGGANRDLALRALLALIGGVTLAFGLGAWMHTQLAAALTLSLALLAFTAADRCGPLSLARRGLESLPGVDLPRALAFAGEGLVPPAIGAPALLATAALAALGIGLARAGLARR